MIIIKRTRIMTTNFLVYSAWEPSPNRNHSTIQSNGSDRWFGRIGTAELPPALAKLRPFSDERLEEVRRFYADEYARAYRAILAEYPHLKDASQEMGEIVEYAPR